MNAMRSDHETAHQVDGIRELDNKLPNWWLATLWVAVAFGGAYWLYFHTSGLGSTADERLAATMAAAEVRLEAQRTAVPAQGLSDRLAAPEMAAKGASLFAANCASCHGAKGEGLIGPNLTDGHWLHGGSAAAIHHSVAAGWPQKGMMAWEPILGPARVDQVVAHLLAIKGTMVPGKAAEGEPDEAPDRDPKP